MPADHLVRAERDGEVAIITLADPARRNALSLEMTQAIASAVAAAVAAAADIGAIVLAAEPPVFCAGGSLDDLLTPRAPLEDMYAGFVALAAAPVPTIAAVGGACVGAGVNLPLACDVIVASPAARFDPRFLDIGIHPGGGHMWRLSERVGRQAAAALVLCGAALDGAEAAAKGLAWACVPEESLMETALGLARRAAPRRRHPDEGEPRRIRAGWTRGGDGDRARGAAVVDGDAGVRRTGGGDEGPHRRVVAGTIRFVRPVRWVGVAGLVLGMVAVACSSPQPEWTLPDRDDPAVRAEESRLADVVEGSGVVWDDFGQMSCEVRLLGSEREASFVWAECGVDIAEGGRAALSVPLRIEGGDVTEARDGSEFDDSVRKMFPPGLAALVFDDPDALRP